MCTWSLRGCHHLCTWRARTHKPHAFPATAYVHQFCWCIAVSDSALTAVGQPQRGRDMSVSLSVCLPGLPACLSTFQPSASPSVSLCSLPLVSHLNPPVLPSSHVSFLLPFLCSSVHIVLLCPVVCPSELFFPSNLSKNWLSYFLTAV